MNGAFHVGGIGLSSQQVALDTIANNIANMHTQTFKRSDIRFSEIMATQQSKDMSRANFTFDPNVAGVTANVHFMLNEQGVIERTQNPLDIAIEGEGFIELMGPAGQILLWRGGSLKVSEDGLLTADNGMALKSYITVPLESDGLEISSDGTVLALFGNDAPPEEIGQISLVRISDVNSVERLDGGLYKLTERSHILDTIPGIDGAGSIIQGAIERSNVDLNREMIQMMIVQRAYAANAQIVQAADQLSSITNNLRQ